ncbi:MAG: hypothetical protein WD876_02425, partial [Candidatus Pacearchaeota archaeon]
GRSFGVVIPMEKIKEAEFSENDALELVIKKKKNPLKETFGTLKFDKTTQEILNESDRESWDG